MTDVRAGLVFDLDPGRGLRCLGSRMVFDDQRLPERTSDEGARARADIILPVSRHLHLFAPSAQEEFPPGGAPAIRAVRYL